MATATVWENGRVNLNLPNVSIITERREAETLRDQLNAALPERIENLVLDPRIKDLHVLQAAQAIAAEHECNGVVKQIGNMIELYYADETQREDGQLLLSELRDTTRDERDAPPEVVDEREVVVAVGDRVLDTMNGHQWRTVTRIEGDQVYLADGGVMGMRECMSSEVRLPSEKLD